MSQPDTELTKDQLIEGILRIPEVLSSHTFSVERKLRRAEEIFLNLEKLLLTNPTLPSKARENVLNAYTSAINLIEETFKDQNPANLSVEAKAAKDLLTLIVNQNKKLKILGHNTAITRKIDSLVKTLGVAADASVPLDSHAVNQMLKNSELNIIRARFNEESMWKDRVDAGTMSISEYMENCNKASTLNEEQVENLEGEFDEFIDTTLESIKDMVQSKLNKGETDGIVKAESTIKDFLSSIDISEVEVQERARVNKVKNEIESLLSQAATKSTSSQNQPASASATATPAVPQSTSSRIGSESIAQQPALAKPKVQSTAPATEASQTPPAFTSSAATLSQQDEDALKDFIAKYGNPIQVFHISKDQRDFLTNPSLKEDEVKKELEFHCGVIMEVKDKVKLTKDSEDHKRAKDFLLKKETRLKLVELLEKNDLKQQQERQQVSPQQQGSSQAQPAQAAPAQPPTASATVVLPKMRQPAPSQQTAQSAPQATIRSGLSNFDARGFPDNFPDFDNTTSSSVGTPGPAPQAQPTDADSLSDFGEAWGVLTRQFNQQTEGLPPSTSGNGFKPSAESGQSKSASLSALTSVQFRSQEPIPEATPLQEPCFEVAPVQSVANLTAEQQGAEQAPGPLEPIQPPANLTPEQEGAGQGQQRPEPLKKIETIPHKPVSNIHKNPTIMSIVNIMKKQRETNSQQPLEISQNTKNNAIHLDGNKYILHDNGGVPTCELDRNPGLDFRGIISATHEAGKTIKISKMDPFELLQSFAAQVKVQGLLKNETFNEKAIAQITSQKKPDGKPYTLDEFINSLSNVPKPPQQDPNNPNNQGGTVVRLPTNKQ